MEPKKGKMVLATFWIDKEEWDRFSSTVAREFGGATKGRDSGKSKKLRQFVHEHNKRHFKGNPQIPLSMFGSNPVRPCQICNEKTPVLWKVLYESGRTLNSCRDCVAKNEERGLVKRNFGLV